MENIPCITKVDFAKLKKQKEKKLKAIENGTKIRK